MNKILYNKIIRSIKTALNESDLFTDDMFSHDSIEDELGVALHLVKTKKELQEELMNYLSEFCRYAKIYINRADNVTVKFDDYCSFTFYFYDNLIKIRRADKAHRSNPPQIFHKNGEWVGFEEPKDAAERFKTYLLKKEII